MCEECGGKFHFKGNILCRISNPVELSHKWVLTNFKYQVPSFYARLFDHSEKVFFEVPPCCTKVDEIKKSVPDAPKFFSFFWK